MERYLEATRIGRTFYITQESFYDLQRIANRGAGICRMEAHEVFSKGR